MTGETHLLHCLWC